jgi:hypothetical protein
MTDLYFGVKQHTVGQNVDPDPYGPDAEYQFLNDSDTWNSATNTLISTAADFTTIFQVGDLVFNRDWYTPHAYVTEVARDYVVFDGAIGGMNDNGFCNLYFDGGDITDPANYTPVEPTFVAYRDVNYDAAYLLKLQSTNINPTRFTAKGGAPDYVQWWYDGESNQPGLPLPEYRVVQVVDDQTLKLDKPISLEASNQFFMGQDGVVSRLALKDTRHMNIYYGINYNTFDIWWQPSRGSSGRWLEPWDSYVISPYNYNMDQMKIRIDDICNRIDGLISGNYSDNWVAIFDEPGAYLG